jgi:hypothetical protein
MSLCSLF